MSNESASTDLRLSVELDRGAGAVQRISVHIEGQGALAAQTAARIAEIYEHAVAEMLRRPVIEAEPVRGAAMPPIAAASSDAPPLAVLPAPEPMLPPREHETQVKERGASVPARPRPTPWFQRRRKHISGGVGIVLFALAVIVPLIVPVEMRREILPMPIAFGLVGALSLFSALLPDPDGTPRASSGAAAETSRRAPDIRTPSRATMRSGPPPSATRRAIGAGFGALLGVGGLVAPFLLAGSNPDERFLMMIGFAPIAAIGAFLMWVFLRQAATAPAGAAIAARRGVRGVRVEESSKSKMTSALTALAVMLAVIVLLVLAATLLQLAR
jgi:hypothetical protein